MAWLDYYDRVSSALRLPSLLDDPLLNLMAYGAAVGFTLEKLGLIPFDRINIDLPDIRRKRSNSFGYNKEAAPVTLLNGRN